ncbi:ABC transporter substrate-binding protein [Nonomuraea sp. PA05]|nr:ABC transporter substrate-binding protein [Nonomuraea sp. PA05]
MAAGQNGELCVGAVVPRTGRLARLGDPLSFAMEFVRPSLRHVVNAGRRHPLRLAWRDSRSDPVTARQAVRDLAQLDKAQIVVTMAGSQVLPAVADACEELGLPCLSTTFPWQGFVYGRGGDPSRPFLWTHHFAWGLDDIADVFTELWQRYRPQPRVGCLWNDDLQGRLLRHPSYGFLPRARARGHIVTDPGGYHEPADSFTGHIRPFLDQDIEVVTSAATEADLTLFCRQAIEQRLRPGLITSSRWLAYPCTAEDSVLAHAGVATLVYWSPRHPYRSSLDGTTPAQLADAYEQRTGNRWLQPLGLAHALVEVAAHALATADDPTCRRSVATTIGRTRLDTIAGTLDWTTGPTPNVAPMPLAGGQWQRERRDHSELMIVTNTGVPEVAVEADLIAAR